MIYLRAKILKRKSDNQIVRFQRYDQNQVTRRIYGDSFWWRPVKRWGFFFWKSVGDEFWTHDYEQFEMIEGK